MEVGYQATSSRKKLQYEQQRCREVAAAYSSSSASSARWALFLFQGVGEDGTPSQSAHYAQIASGEREKIQ